MATSGNALFDRRCLLTIAIPVATPKDFSHTTSEVIEIDGGTTDRSDVPGMRVQFHVTKTLKKEPNTSQIIVTNLSPTRRSSLQIKGVKTKLEAGYKENGTFGIFSGDVRTIDHVREGADWNTTMRLGDGERAWKYARVFESFAPGTLVSDALRTIGKALSLDLGNLDQQLGTVNATLDQGFAAAGSASSVFDQLITSIRKTWSIQDGALQILDPYGTLDLPIPEVTPDSGLIGSPEMGTPPAKGKPAFLKFKSLLIPTKPGAKVKLKSSRYNGFIRVHSCVFSGDTHGGEWYTEIEGTILK